MDYEHILCHIYASAFYFGASAFSFGAKRFDSLEFIVAYCTTAACGVMVHVHCVYGTKRMMCHEDLESPVLQVWILRSLFCFRCTFRSLSSMRLCQTIGMSCWIGDNTVREMIHPEIQNFLR